MIKKSLSFDVFNPATQLPIGSVARVSQSEVEAAVEAMVLGFARWRLSAAEVRARLLKAWHQRILENREALAVQLTQEQGKPLAEARGEIAYAAAFVEWYAEEARRAYGRVIPSPWEGSSVEVRLEPVGVCGMITPWNFPAAMITRKVAAALAAGCVAMVKPAMETPLTALALERCAREVGITEDVFRVVTGDAEAIVSVWMRDVRVRKISFTGSTRVGKLLMEQAAPTLKRLSLELGGNAPFIVCADADVSQAVAGLMHSKFRGSGQTCVCANRVLVHSHVAAEFQTQLEALMASLVVGNGLDAGVTQGPLIHLRACERVEALIADAVEKGARVVMGGVRADRAACFFPPTLITGVTPEMRMFREEIFGPVVALTVYDSDEEALRLANDCEYGLASYCYTTSLARAHFFRDGLNCGMVAINSGVISTEVAPFGGRNFSGFGREGGVEGMWEYLEVKYVRS